MFHLKGARAVFVRPLIGLGVRFFFMCFSDL